MTTLLRPQSEIYTALTKKNLKKEATEAPYFFWAPSFHMSGLNINISTGPSNLKFPLRSNLNFSTSVKRVLASHSRSFTILPRDTLASRLNLMNERGRWNYNAHWWREIPLPKDLILKKDQFFLDLAFEMEWTEETIAFFRNISQNYIIALKTPTYEED